MLRGDLLVEIQSQDIRVGDIVYISLSFWNEVFFIPRRRNEEIPCDLVLLCSSDSNGHSYIQTSNIDGEANLKLRKVPEVLRESLQSDSQEQIQKNLNTVEIEIDCGNPDAHIYRFDGK